MNGMMKTIDVEPQASDSATVMLREYWSVAVRRKWVIIGSIILSLTVAWVICQISPKSYRSESLILVEDQKIPENIVQGVVEANLEQRIFVIQKQIMSRTLLGEIVKEFKLYPDEAAKNGPHAAIAKVRSAVRVEMVAKMGRGNFVGRTSVDAFTVSFSHENPDTARMVTARIASKFIEENLRARERIAEGTTEFLDLEVVRGKLDLERKEDEISRFKAKHMGELPQQIEPNLRALDRLQGDLNATNEGMRRVSDRQAMVEKAIQEYERFGKMNPALAAGSTESDPLFRRHRELKEKLAKLSAEFKDTYPETILTKDEIHLVERELVEAYGPDALKPGEKPRDPYLQELKKQQSEVTSELALLKRRQSLLQAEKKAYVERIEKAPAVEQELLILQRDYDNMKNNFGTLADKRLNARVAENLEKRQQGGQFRIIDPASFPGGPESPNQPRIMMLGLIIGCALGMGIAVLQEQLNPQFRRPEDIEHVLGPQLLAAIPDFSLLSRGMIRHRFLPIYNLSRGTNGHDGGEEMRTMPWKRLLGQGTGNLPFERNLLVKWLPASFVAEQYRVAATRLALIAAKDHSMTMERSTVVVVTSAVKGEGKTTTVVNLGYTLARDLGKRTVMIDCDFKSPVLNRYAQTDSERGLADCLRGDSTLDECLSGFDDVPCSILPVGNCETQSNELLKTGRLTTILSELRQRFEYVLINAPPILPLADMNVLAGHADALVLVVRAGSTPQQVVKRAVNTLRAEMPLHVILNAVGTESLPNYMYDYMGSGSEIS